MGRSTENGSCNSVACSTWRTIFPAVLLAVALIWLPFGFSLSALIEEWGLLGMFTEHGTFFLATADSPFALHRLRPLTLFPQAVGYALNHDSFLWWHLQQMLCILLKGVAAAALVLWLSRRRGAALFAAVLMMVYPADTMQIPFRSLHINMSAMLTINALALMLWATERVILWQRATMMLLAAFCLVSASLMYEAALFLVPAPLIFWWARYGWREGLRRLLQQKVVIILWALAAGIGIGYVLWVSHESNLYQQALSKSPMHTLEIIRKNFGMMFTIGMYRLWLNGWWDAARMLFSAGSWAMYLPVALLFAAVIAWKSEQTETAEKMPCMVAVRWGILALALAMLGYLPYVASYSHLLITQRSYLFCTLGGVMLVTLMHACLQRRFPRIGMGLATLLITLGFAAQWTQFAHYERIASQQKVVLTGVLEALPKTDPNQNILIFDQQGSLGNVWMLRGEILRSALTYLYGHRVNPIVCMEPGKVWASFITDAQMRLGHCVEKSDHWEIGGDVDTAIILAKKETPTLVRNLEGVIRRVDAPVDAIDANQARRWKKILNCWPSEDCRQQATKTPGDHFEYDFGHWWSLEEPQPGAGWQDAQWMPPAWQPRSMAWKNEPDSSLSFELMPDKVPYEFSMRLAMEPSGPARNGLVIELNGHPLPLIWTGSLNLHAEIDPAWLHTGWNRLLLSTPVDRSGVSLGVDWVKVRPVKR